MKIGLGKFLRGGVDAEKAFDNISSGINKLAFTKQEQAELRVTLADRVAKFAEKSLNENTIRSGTRRFIAYTVVINVILMAWFMFIILLFGIEVNASLIKPFLEVVGVFQLGWAFVTVLIFFFGGYYYNQIKNGGKTDGKRDN